MGTGRVLRVTDTLRAFSILSMLMGATVGRRYSRERMIRSIRGALDGIAADAAAGPRAFVETGMGTGVGLGTEEVRPHIGGWLAGNTLPRIILVH